MKPDLILSVRDLSVSITGRAGTVVAAKNISFDLGAGETLAIVGESGSGKSMTALSLIGLAPVGTSVTSTGEALFEGKDLLKLSERELRNIRGSRIGTVFQDPSASLNPLMSVGAQIREAIHAAQLRHKAAPGSVKSTVTRLLDEVSLLEVPDIAHRYPHELSGGQQQRVMIAIALAGNPSLLIADEPTTALDATVQAQILQLLKRLQRARGMSMLMISHNLGLVADLAQGIVILRQGAIVERGPASGVIANPRTAYARALVSCVPRVGVRLDRLPTIDRVDESRSSPTARQNTTARSLVEVRDLVVTYPGRGPFAPEVRGVDGVSLAIPHGGALGIVGESGSGKSTLAKAFVGLVRSRSGSIIYRDETIVDPSRMSQRLRCDIQYIFQDAFGALNPRKSVEQAIAEPMSIHGLHRGRDRRSAILKLLDEVGLASMHLDRLPHELSGGQRQRVTIARALALEPQVLICDEIVSALDVSVQAQILNLLKDLQELRGLTLIFISHDLSIVAHMCDAIAVMKSGKVVEYGQAETILKAPTESYTRRLLRAAELLELPPGGAGKGIPELSGLERESVGTVLRNPCAA